jgi:hypothetical protein
MTQAARDMLKGPVLGLKITAILGALAALVSIAVNVLGIGAGAMEGEEALPAMMSGGIGVAMGVVGACVAVFLWVAAGKMQNLVSYNLCLIACIVAMVPCVSPCCLLGLPIGIWAVIMLNKPEVKSAFTG